MVEDAEAGRHISKTNVVDNANAQSLAKRAVGRLGWFGAIWVGLGQIVIIS